ncbi:MAG: ShlB/FhaC/HecB family hemolysin secretion/activation protein [Victivallales bacterium]|nr:ShlB/FhaC/HecB family hemolysin secretion/activation protein [Victivallales bacterium]
MRFGKRCLHGVLAFFCWTLLGWGAEAPGSVGRTFSEIRVEGDVEAVKGLPFWRSWSTEWAGRPMSSTELEEARRELLSALQGAGYLFAQVEFVDLSPGDGVLAVRVDCGVFGEFSVRRHGRHYTARQIIARLSGRGQTFNYVEFCRRLASANSGDLKIDVTLKPTRRERGVVVDVELDYEDSLPLHGALSLTNAAASEAKSPLQLRAGVQMLNLLRRDDVLSLYYVTNGDVGGEVNAGYGSFHLPLGDCWAFTAFGSWSDSAYGDVLPDLDVLGRGYSYGVQLEREIWQDGRRRLAMALGWRLASMRNRLRLYSEMLDTDSARVSMPYLNLSYGDLRLDAWNGRDFASVGVCGNQAGRFGASETRAFRAEGRGADGTFWQTRLTAARLQRLFAGEECPGKWTLFVRLQALYSSEASPNACREFLGGWETVRGYREAEASGDTVLNGSLELRTPLLENHPDEAASAEGTGRFQLHGVLFADFGWLTNHEDNVPENGRRRHQELVSIGAGLRLGWGKSLQFVLDYALPLNRHATPDTPSDGRWHFSWQIQF